MSTNWEIYLQLLRGELVEMGSKGSGNWGHKGRKGKRGGSAPAKAPTPGSKKENTKFKKGDLVASLRAGGFGGWSQGAKAALVLGVEGDEYKLYIIEGSEYATRPASFITELSEEHRARIEPRLGKWLTKLEAYNLREGQPIHGVREALRLATQ